MYVYPVPGARRAVPCVVGRGTRIVEACCGGDSGGDGGDLYGEVGTYLC